MAICRDCIQPLDSRNGGLGPVKPCEGFTISVIFTNGRTDSSPLIVKDNPLSLIGFDYTFEAGGLNFTIVYDGANWVVLDDSGNKLFVSSDPGSSNNLCPPTTGWTNVGGTFTSFFVEELLPPGPSVDCVNSNATFDTNTTGWTVANGAWAADFGGTIKYNTSLLGSAQQASILSIGETYTISVDYYAVIPRVACSPLQYSAGFIQILAGTNFYRTTLLDTTNEVGQVINITVDLTCEVNTTLRVEIQDPNQCFGTVQGAGFRGIFVDNICAVLVTNVVDPVGPSPLPSIEYGDNARVPSQTNQVDYNTKLQDYQNCLATKGTTFYNKVIGAVQCDAREIQKLKLIIGLLAQKDIDRALGCIYDGQLFPTALYLQPPTNLPLASITAGSTSVTLTGDYSRFESYTIKITSTQVFTSTIIDAVYDVLANTTTLTFYNPIPANAVTVTVDIIAVSDYSNDYLEVFINFANQFCANCLTTGPSPTPTPPLIPSLEIPQSPLITESGVSITTEFNIQITL